MSPPAHAGPAQGLPNKSVVSPSGAEDAFLPPGLCSFCSLDSDAHSGEQMLLPWLCLIGGLIFILLAFFHILLYPVEACVSGICTTSPIFVISTQNDGPPPTHPDPAPFLSVFICPRHYIWSEFPLGIMSNIYIHSLPVFLLLFHFGLFCFVFFCCCCFIMCRDLYLL